MKRVNKKVLLAMMLATVTSTGLMACKPYDTPEYKDITPSQTAFAIPLEGNGADQVKIDSEESAKNNLITSKRVQVPHRWNQTGKGVIWEDGTWIPTIQVIIVERKPVTREWTEAKDTGTDAKNQGIKAESKESLGFTARMNCTASIQESEASKYLYNYNDKTLEEVMDTEIRANVESKFVQECAKRSMDEILSQKEQIMTAVRDEVVDTFTKKGVTINQLGLKGDFTYDNAKTQEAIDAKFQAEKNQEAQQITNETNKAKAIADAEVIKSQASTMTDTIKLKEAEAKLAEAQAKQEMAKAMQNWKDIKVLGDNPVLGQDFLK
jgi:regulator of protease activity HflC (stomatin/prohibitin superfamily)